MRHLKLFENFDETEEDIKYILLDLIEDFPELKFTMLKDNPFLWRFHSISIIGRQNTITIYKKMGPYIEEIKGRLLDIGIKSESSIRSSRSTNDVNRNMSRDGIFAKQTFEIIINLKFN